MTEFLAGGRRRIDRVLAPDYLADLAACTLDELRDRRAEADQEEVDLSYARRLLQGRIDILRAEHDSRRGHGPLTRQSFPHTDAEIVDALKRILTDDRAEKPNEMARHVGGEPSRVGEHRREAERAVADVGGSDLAAMSDSELEHALADLAAIEGRVSRARRQVQVVVDALSDEIARRYQVGVVSLADQL
jgi:hypothetical protein